MAQREFHIRPLPNLSVCLGFRDWHLDHLDRCLLSLRSMTGPRAPDLEIVLVDLGSTWKTRDQLCKMAGKYRIFTSFNERPVWSRSWALNRASKFVAPITDYYAFTDADMIFPPDWLEKVLKNLQPGRLLLTRSRDIHQQMMDGSLKFGRHDNAMNHWKALPLEEKAVFLTAITKPHPDVGMGAAMVIPKRWFRGVRGFDEFYTTWGAEDNDLVARAQWDGLAVEWLPDVAVYHQWHPRDWPSEEDWVRVKANRQYLKERLDEQGPIERNPDYWAGALLTRELNEERL
jgi:GT2 family glycosyltransferase